MAIIDLLTGDNNPDEKIEKMTYTVYVNQYLINWEFAFFFVSRCVSDNGASSRGQVRPKLCGRQTRRDMELDHSRVPRSTHWSPEGALSRNVG